MDFLRRLPAFVLIHGGNRHHVKGKDDIGFGLISGGCLQRFGGPGHSAPQQVFLDDRLDGHVVITLRELLHQMQGRNPVFDSLWHSHNLPNQPLPLKSSFWRTCLFDRSLTVS